MFSRQTSSCEVDHALVILDDGRCFGLPLDCIGDQSEVWRPGDCGTLVVLSGSQKSTSFRQRPRLSSSPRVGLTAVPDGLTFVVLSCEGTFETSDGSVDLEPLVTKAGTLQPRQRNVGVEGVEGGDRARCRKGPSLRLAELLEDSQRSDRQEPPSTPPTVCPTDTLRERSNGRCARLISHWCQGRVRSPVSDSRCAPHLDRACQG